MLKTGGDDDAAQLDHHALEGRLGLGGVPTGAGRVVGGVLQGVAVAGVPEDDEAVGDQSEGHGALDGAAQAVARLSDAQDAPGVEEDWFDAPARSVAGDQVFGCCDQVGGDQRQAVASLVLVLRAGFVVAFEDGCSSLEGGAWSSG